MLEGPPPDRETLAQIVGALGRNLFTGKFDPAQRKAIARSMRPVDVAAGDVVIREGDEG